MIYLKIENNKGFYRLETASGKWMEIDQIGKDHLLTLLKLASIEDFEMDEYKEELLQNPAHNIIYKSVYNKFKDFLSNKTRFKDSVDALYKAALEKYKMEDA